MGVRVTNGFCDKWWLRSPGDTAAKAATVSYGGFISRAGEDVDMASIFYYDILSDCERTKGGLGVRPAMWIDLGS